MPTAAIALGSNLASAVGSPDATIWEAVRRMEGLGRVVAVSHLIETDPVEVVDQPRFTNGAAVLETELGPVALLEGLQEIERGLGRVREGVARRGPRTLDLDLLLYDEVVLVSEVLMVPHPAMHERGFVLRPMVEVAGGMRHPVLGRTMVELLEEWERREGTVWCG